jgi:hypothetical protein
MMYPLLLQYYDEILSHSDAVHRYPRNDAVSRYSRNFIRFHTFSPCTCHDADCM